MSPGKKQVFDLADEFLTDVAAAFFDARCKLDAMIEAFEAAVSHLRQEAERVARNAAVLRTVLIDDAAVQTLFQRLGVDPAPFAGPLAAVEDCRIPVAPLWGRRRRYRAVVVEAYRRLEAAVGRYRDGLPDSGDSGDESGSYPVYYRLVQEMARLINTRIEAVNRQCSPSELLQYVKQFDPAKIEREGITGAGGGSCGLDDRLCYRPLDFDALALPVFPPLIAPEHARDTVTATADAVYRDRPDAVARLLEGLKKAQDNCRPASGPGATL